MIGLVVESNHLINHSGITTFIYHILDIFDNDVVIYTNKKVKSYIRYTTNIDDLDKCSKIIVNCITSLKFVVNKIEHSKLIFYTHYPFLFVNEDSDVKFLKTVPDITIATQTHKLKYYFSEMFKNKIIVIPQPFSKKFITTETILEQKNKALIISNGEERKNYELMIKCLSKVNIPITCICSSNQLYVKLLLEKYKIKHYKILSDINNKYMSFIIKQHKFLLHLGEHEIFPYSIYESMMYIPCIINGWSKWGKSFTEAHNIIKVPVKDSELIAEIIIDTIAKNWDINNEDIIDSTTKEWLKLK